MTDLLLKKNKGAEEEAETRAEPQTQKSAEKVRRSIKSKNSVSVSLFSGNRLKYTPIERWTVLLQKILYKIQTTKEMNGESDWQNMYQAYCDNVLQPMRKLKKMEILGRWVKVMRKVNQKMQVKSNKINIKWIRLTSDLIRLSRCRRLFIQRKFARLAQKVLVLDIFTRQM